MPWKGVQRPQEPTHYAVLVVLIEHISTSPFSKFEFSIGLEM